MLKTSAKFLSPCCATSQLHLPVAHDTTDATSHYSDSLGALQRQLSELINLSWPKIISFSQETISYRGKSKRRLKPALKSFTALQLSCDSDLYFRGVFKSLLSFTSYLSRNFHYEKQLQLQVRLQPGAFRSQGKSSSQPGTVKCRSQFL